MIEVSALRLELKQQVEQRLTVLFRQRRGRLVEDQQLHILGQRLGDLDKLLLAGADIGDQRVGIFAQADLVEKLGARDALVRSQLMTPPVACSLPRNMFSAMESIGTSASS
jgi:hypothetical protein